MRIALVTDAWFPQVNGVVRTLSTVRDELQEMGHTVEVISPDRFRTIPCPTYPEIRLALFPGSRLKRMLREFRPEAVHIATEGPLGWAARRWCRRRKLPFTTSFHTRFPEYVHARVRVPVRWSYAVMRRFHGPSSGVMVATPSLMRELEARGFRNVKRWTRGVDLDLFRPVPPEDRHFADLPRPVFLYCGRVAVEKNIGAFLDLDLPGSKVVVGDGPSMSSLRKQHPEVHFAGYRTGEDLARHVGSGDVFVFPSLTDTFGLVLLEALACGVPVAAYPVTGPVDVITDPAVGILDEDLGAAATRAAELDPSACRPYAERYSWRACAELFLANLQPFPQLESDTARTRAPAGDA